jgi:hypothetical protein
MARPIDRATHLGELQNMVVKACADSSQRGHKIGLREINRIIRQAKSDDGKLDIVERATIGIAVAGVTLFNDLQGRDTFVPLAKMRFNNQIEITDAERRKLGLPRR